MSQSTTKFQKYINRSTKEVVTAMKYTAVSDFNYLKELIGDIYPALTPAHTRIYEGNWIVRKSDNTVEYICCAHGENCFEKKYEVYK